MRPNYYDGFTKEKQQVDFFLPFVGYKEFSKVFFEKAINYCNSLKKLNVAKSIFNYEVLRNISKSFLSFKKQRLLKLNVCVIMMDAKKRIVKMVINRGGGVKALQHEWKL